MIDKTDNIHVGLEKLASLPYRRVVDATRAVRGLKREVSDAIRRGDRSVNGELISFESPSVKKSLQSLVNKRDSAIAAFKAGPRDVMPTEKVVSHKKQRGVDRLVKLHKGTESRSKARLFGREMLPLKTPDKYRQRSLGRGTVDEFSPMGWQAEREAIGKRFFKRDNIIALAANLARKHNVPRPSMDEARSFVRKYNK